MSDLPKSDIQFIPFIDFTNCPFNIFWNRNTELLMKPSSVFRIISQQRTQVLVNELTIPDTLEEQMKDMKEGDEIYDFR
jgi:hypothetical protein